MGKAKVDLNSVTTVGLDLAKQVFRIFTRWMLTAGSSSPPPCDARTCCLSSALYRPAS